MTTFYLDFEGGNDANDGLSFANRWKTITSGATAARTAPGDVIRVMASAAATSLGQSATWTDDSSTVTLTTAVTANIMTCDSAFTASANVTAATSSTTQREGTASASLAFAAGFTTGKAGYFATGTLNLSGYQQISLWLRSTTATAANTITIKLCSDTIGDVPVDTFTLAVANVAGIWHNYTFDKGSALGSAIESIAIYADIDPGTPTWNFDNIIACKAASAADSLTHRSLISKNAGSDVEWWPISSINGTTIVLNGAAGITTDIVLQQYHGVTETVTTYKREIYGLHNTTTATQAFQESGTASAYIEYSGGWNRTDMSTQTDVTWLGGRGAGSGLDTQALDYLKISKLYLAYWATGYDLATTASIGHELADCACSNVSTGVLSSGNAGGRITNYVFGVCTSVALSFSGGGVSEFSASGGRLIVPETAGTYPLNVLDPVGQLDLYFSHLIGGTSAILTNGAGGDIRFKNTQISRQLTSGLDLSVGVKAHLFNCLLGPTTEFSGVGAAYSIMHDQTADTHKIYLANSVGTIVSATDQRHTASGISWKFLLTATLTAVAPAKLSLAKVAVAAGALVTVTLWCRRNNTGLTLGLFIPKGQIAGLSTDVTTAMTAAIDTWEEITATFTPTEAGVVEIFAYAYGGTTYSGWVDDITITQA